MQFLSPIFDGLGWTFRLIGGGRTGGTILGVALVLAVVWAWRFWKNAQWQPGRPLSPEVIAQLREHRSTVAAGLGANMEKPLHPIFDDQVKRLQISDGNGSELST